MCDGKIRRILLLPKRQLDIEGDAASHPGEGDFPMSVFTRDIGIDLGTASVLVYIKGKGIVLREPSVVAVDETTHTIIDVGTGALNMLGRTPRGISAIRPLKNGVISDYDLTERMIHYYLKQVLGRFSFARPRVVVCVPSGVTELERRSVVEATMDAGSMDTRLIEEPVAAAIGAGLPVTKAGGCMVVDIGGGTTDIAVISMSSAVVKESVAMAGDKVDEAITKHMRRRHNLHIGERTAERIKIQLAVVSPGTCGGRDGHHRPVDHLRACRARSILKRRKYPKRWRRSRWRSSRRFIPCSSARRRSLPPIFIKTASP